MEIFVTICIGILGAGATILAAYIQRGRSEAQLQAEEARSTKLAPAPVNLPSGRSAGREPAQDVHATLYFPGDNSLYKMVGVPETYMKVHGERVEKLVKMGDVEVLLDGDLIGRGDISKGFKLQATTTVGMHELVVLTDIEVDFIVARTGKRVHTLPVKQHMSTEIVFSKPGSCIVRLHGRPRFEPRDAGYAPIPRKVVMWLCVIGAGLIVLCSVALWLLLK